MRCKKTKQLPPDYQLTEEYQNIVTEILDNENQWSFEGISVDTPEKLRLGIKKHDGYNMDELVDAFKRANPTCQTLSVPQIKGIINHVAFEKDSVAFKKWKKEMNYQNEKDFKKDLEYIFNEVYLNERNENILKIAKERGITFKF